MIQQPLVNFVEPMAQAHAASPLAGATFNIYRQELFLAS